jgi:hypothetical protein
MPDGPDVPRPAEWSAWLALPSEQALPPVTPNAFKLTFGSKYLTRALIASFVTLALCLISLKCALVAIARGQTDVLWLLFFGHLPLGVRTFRAWKRLQTELQSANSEESTEQPPTHLMAYQHTRMTSEGLRGKSGRRDWSEFAGFEYLGEDSGYLRFRLHLAARDALQPRKTTPLRWAAFLVPTCVTIAAFLIGLSQFGQRTDVLTAFVLMLAHLTGLIVVYLMRREALYIDEQRRQERPSLDVLLDLRQVTANEVLRRLERYLPPTGPT